MTRQVKFIIACMTTVTILVLGTGAVRGNIPDRGQPVIVTTTTTSTTSTTISTTTTSTAPCQEDDPCWNCETMGNKVCGEVNVEIYREGAHQWVRIWDTHNRLVFGPVWIEGVER